MNIAQRSTMSSTIDISSLVLTIRAFYPGLLWFEELPSFFLTSGAKNIYFSFRDEENAGEMDGCVGER